MESYNEFVVTTAGPAKIVCKGGKQRQSMEVYFPAFDLAEASWEEIFSLLVQKNIKRLLVNRGFDEIEITKQNLQISEVGVDKLTFILDNKYKGTISYPTMFDASQNKKGILNSPRIGLTKV